MGSKTCSAVVALTLSLAPWAGIAAERPKLAVLDLEGKGVPEDLVKNLADVLTASLGRLGVFDILARSDIEQMLDFESEKASLGCNDPACLAELGGALGVAQLVTGSVGKVGSKYLISLTLIDTRRAAVLSREQRDATDVDELLRVTDGAARFLVRGLLEAEEGFLLLNVAEAGADVEIDGRIVGVTPLGRLTLPGGPHTLRIVKKGFIAWAKDVEVQKTQPVMVDAVPIPSVEFIEAYDERVGTWRLLAYTAGAIGIAAVGFGIGGWVWNGGRGDTFKSDLAAAGCEEGSGQSSGADCADLLDRRDDIQRFDLITSIVGGVGVVALATGVILWLQGPTPGIYDRYKPSTDARLGLSVSPAGNGAHVTMSASW